ncbi:MAG TPA: peptide MFS transporter [Azospirillaceae bacterium]|nr:peptide MFS transporter [Azospirillaceae bacterium]
MSTMMVSGERAGWREHPRGLAYLAFTEAWERFSYYGMSALLVLYMVDQVLQPGRADAVLGFGLLRSVLEGATGPLSPTAMAAQLTGLYSGLVYFTPVLGGIIADRWIGQRAAVLAGGVLMFLGHVAMTFDASFLIALLLLILGSGLLKGNISAQVGALYPEGEETNRTRGFAIFSMAINVGAVCGPLLCGWLAQAWSWHAGFGAAALFMAVGLAIYVAGWNHLPARVERERTAETGLTAEDRRTVLLLLGVMAVTCFQSIVFFQGLTVNPLWVQERVDLVMLGFAVPVPWFSSIDALASVVFVPVIFWLWRLQTGGNGDPADLSKIAMGAAIFCVANLGLAAADLMAGADKVPALWAAVYHTLQGIAFVYYWPTLLAMVSRLAPPSLNSTLMGVAFLTLFLSNIAVGWLGTRYETWGGPAFWAVHGAIAAAGVAAAMVMGRVAARRS